LPHPFVRAAAAAIWCCTDISKVDQTDHTKLTLTMSDERNAKAYKDEKGFTTIALHHGHKLDTDNRARAVPIFQTTSFEFKSASHGASLFALAELGPIYTRICNPTNHVFEYKMAELEGAPCKAHGNYDNAATLPNSLAVASGQSAQMHALLTFMQAGDNFIAASELYGGTISQRAPPLAGPATTTATTAATARVSVMLALTPATLSRRSQALV
jgi:hypothetical protein